jgi:solute carrier family 38 (sodium-coupled neutral amino acid transporter), member 9
MLERSGADAEAGGGGPEEAGGRRTKRVASLDGVEAAGAADAGAEGARQTRWSTVASIVNTMMGTTIVALPYAFSRCGVLLGLALVGVVGATACFTTLVVLRRMQTSGLDDYAAMMTRYLGRVPGWVAFGTGVGILVGAVCIYHVLMTESLHSLVLSIAGRTEHTADPSVRGWTYPVAAAVLCAVFPIACLRDMTLLVRFNSVGFLFLWYVMLFILYHGFAAIASGDVAVVGARPADAPDWEHVHGDRYKFSVALGVRESFGVLAGILMLSFYIHNVIAPIVRNAPRATRDADVTIAFSIAGVIYAAVGIMGYFGFGSVLAAGRLPAPSADHPHPALPVVQSDFIEAFPHTLNSAADGYAFSVRLALLLQLVTVYPILCSIIRSQVSVALFGTDWPGYAWVIGINVVVVAVAFLCAAFQVSLSTIMRFFGAIGGWIIVFVFPMLADLVGRLEEAQGIRIPPPKPVEDKSDGNPSRHPPAQVSLTGAASINRPLLHDDVEDAPSAASSSSTTPASKPLDVSWTALGQLPALFWLQLAGVVALATSLLIVQFVNALIS